MVLEGKLELWAFNATWCLDFSEPLFDYATDRSKMTV